MRVGDERGRGVRVTEPPAHKLELRRSRASVQLRAAPTSCRSTTSSLTRRPPHCILKPGQLLRECRDSPAKYAWTWRLSSHDWPTSAPTGAFVSRSTRFSWRFLSWAGTMTWWTMARGISWIGGGSSGPPECSAVPVRSYFPMNLIHLRRASAGLHAERAPGVGVAKPWIAAVGSTRTEAILPLTMLQLQAAASSRVASPR